MEDLRRGAGSAEVLELPPGATWRQVSHAVLLRGSLQRAAEDHHSGGMPDFGPLPA